MGVFRSSGRSSPLEPSQALEVIDQIGHTDLDGGAGNADGSHGQPHPIFLPGEHMLDVRADLGSLGVSLGDPLRHQPPRLAPLVDVALEHASGEERLVLLGPVGCVRPHARTGVAVAEQDRQPRAVMGIRGTGTSGADQPMCLVDADVTFVTEHGNSQIDGLCRLGIGAVPDLVLAVLDRPARISVRLPGLGWLPVLGHAPLLDR